MEVYCETQISYRGENVELFSSQSSKKKKNHLYLHVCSYEAVKRKSYFSYNCIVKYCSAEQSVPWLHSGDNSRQQPPHENLPADCQKGSMCEVVNLQGTPVKTP